MDPISHALVGAGLAGLSGGEISLTNPLVLACVAGSLAPDLDIVYQVKGDMAYLKKHRGFSHSILGLVLLSGGIAASLALIFPEVSAGKLFFWAFSGALSHSLLDVLNSYGAKIALPFSNKSYAGNLLMITDPVLLVLFLGVFFLPGTAQLNSLFAITGFLLYLLGRLLIRIKIECFLKKKFILNKLKRVAVMPSLASLWNWDFVIETDRKCLVGQVNSLHFSIDIRRKFSKSKKTELIQTALNSKLGKLFKEFTPYYYMVLKEADDSYEVKFLDLRYLLKRDFLHTGTAVIDRQLKILDAEFAPYNKRRRIKLGA